MNATSEQQRLIICDNRADWLRARARGIGSSDASVLHGASKYSSPYNLWCQKTGILPPANDDKTEYQRWGHIMEQPIADEYARITGRGVVDRGEFTISTHREHHYIQATHDRIITCPERGVGELSIKTAAPWLAPEWADATAPIDYMVQLQHGLLVSNLDFGSFAVLIWGRGVMWFDVDRDDDFLAQHERLCVEFWHKVINGEAPPVDADKSTAAALNARFPTADSKKTVKLPMAALRWDQEIADSAAAIKKLDTRIDELKNKLRAAIGDAQVGQLPDGGEWTWSSGKKGRSLRRRKGQEK